MEPAASSAVELDFEVHGPEGARAIVLLHGSPLDRRMWRPQLEDFLGAGYRLVLADLRGHGKSPVPPAPWNVDDCAADVVALADRLGLERFVVGGLSVGAVIAAAAARQAPERAEALLLAASNVAFETPQGRAALMRAAEELRARGAIAGEDFVPRVFTPETVRQRPALVKEFLEIANGQPVAGRAAMIGAVANRPDLVPWLEQWHHPLLAIAGEEDPIAPPSMSREVHRRVRGSFLQVIEGASHMVNMEAPGVFNRAALNWLEYAGLDP